MKLSEQLKRARAVGVPILAIATQDQPRTIKEIRDLANGKAPAILWDCVRGIGGLNDAGAQAVRQLCQDAQIDPIACAQLPDALNLCANAPEDAIIVACNAHRTLEDAQPAQAILNLREPFKTNGRTLMLIGPSFRLPPELAQDVYMIDEPLPEPDEIGAILAKLIEDNGIQTEPDTLPRATTALRGLSAFSIEQSAAVSVTRDMTIDHDELWQRKKTTIRQTDALTLEEPRFTREDAGGLAACFDYFAQRFAGPLPPMLFVLVDEIDKSMAGAGASGAPGDSSGTTQDQLKFLLQEMEDWKDDGCLNLGAAGTGKSFMIRVLASIYRIPLLSLDLGAAKGSLVGESERKIRAASKLIHSLVTPRDCAVFWWATANQLDSIPAPLRRRFTSGLWFYDLPDAQERCAIGKIQMRAHNLDEGPDMEAYWTLANGWSAADIRNCCRQAYANSISIKDASRRIVPAAQQDPQGLAKLRDLASGKFLSASYEGTYTAPSLPAGAQVDTTRRIKQEN